MWRWVAQPRDLRVELAHDLVLPQIAARPGPEHVARVRGEAPLGRHERPHERRIAHGASAREREVHTHAQRRGAPEQLRRVREILAVAEHGRARDDARLVRAHDAARDGRRQAEVVGVHHQRDAGRLGGRGHGRRR
jgi:hypothetical protein